MKLLLPVTGTEDVKEFKKISDEIEFYAGLSLNNWTEHFGEAEELNRMSAFKKSANIGAVEELHKIVESADGIPVFVTLNSAAYSVGQEAFLSELMKQLVSIGVTGVILGDLFLVDMVKKHGLKAVASTMVGVYNADIARLCKTLGFDRLILPRDITLLEMEEIVNQVPDVEYECFIIRNGCRYSDSNCLGRHSDRFGAICTWLDRSKVHFGGEAESNFYRHNESVYNHHVYTQAFHASACGICALWRLKKMGICAGKVVGRADGWESIIDDVIDLTENITIAKKCQSENEYLEQMHFPKRYHTICYQGMNCYYPEIRF